MKKLFLALGLLLISSAAMAECYPAANGNANVPPCAAVNSYVNGSNKSQPVTASTPLPSQLNFQAAGGAASAVTQTTPLPTETRNVLASYSYQAADVTPAATATDVMCLVDSATKTIKLVRVQASADATGAAVIDLYVYKRTAANTGGTATQPALTKLDSADAAATGVINLYSANPSALGAGTLLVGDHYEIPAVTGNTYASPPWIEDFGNHNAKALILHGTSEQACFSLGGATLPAGLNVYMRFEWTEE